jgi:hypothetical protein
MYITKELYISTIWHKFREDIKGGNQKVKSTENQCDDENVKNYNTK